MTIVPHRRPVLVTVGVGSGAKAARRPSLMVISIWLRPAPGCRFGRLALIRPPRFGGRPVLIRPSGLGRHSVVDHLALIRPSGLWLRRITRDRSICLRRASGVDSAIWLRRTLGCRPSGFDSAIRPLALEIARDRSICLGFVFWIVPSVAPRILLPRYSREENSSVSTYTWAIRMVLAELFLICGAMIMEAPL